MNVPATQRSALIAELKECGKRGDLGRGKWVHAEATKSGLDCSIYVASALITMYAKCGSMLEARQIFDAMHHPDVVSWNTLILGYADNGEGCTALYLLTRMKSEGFSPNSSTFVAALKACSSLAVKAGASGWAECRNRGRVIQNLSEEHSNMYVQCALVDLYSRCGSMVEARRVFDNAELPDAVSWNALILGYADNGQSLTALGLFTKMLRDGPSPTTVTFVAALKACTCLAVNERANEACMQRGRAMHYLIAEHGYSSDVCLQNTLIDMFGKCGSIEDARQVFDSMKQRTAVSWSTLILGYAENGQGFIALNLFTRMKSEGPEPNSVTFLAALKACGLVGALDFGRTVHADIHRGNELDIVRVTCLVDFYAKCGSLVEAQSVFDSHAEARDTITWNALLAGFSSCGDEEHVFRLFQGMQDAGYQPDSITFLFILKCCSHAGLAEKGKECFDSMRARHGIVPTLQHYTCMIDIFGRGNKLNAAAALLRCMPCSPDTVTWTILLGACHKWKNVGIGRLAFQALVHVNDRDAAVYVVMGQIYASRGMLQEQEMVMETRNELKACKASGQTCWTSELGLVHSFSA